MPDGPKRIERDAPFHSIARTRSSLRNRKNGDYPCDFCGEMIGAIGMAQHKKFCKRRPG